MSSEVPAVFYVSNRYFLFPTLSSIFQLLKTTTRARYKVYLFLVDVSSVEVEEISKHLSRYGVRVLVLPPERLSFDGSIDFSRSRIPSVALGRFCVGDMIPECHSKLIYLDGDVLALSDISSLIEIPIQEGFIYGVSEHLWLTKSIFGSYWKRHRLYLSYLGIDSPKDYFNAGVFVVNRKTWIDRGAQCLEYFGRHNNRYLYVDQSALNHVFLGKRKSLSPLYNYTSEYAMLVRPDRVSARIVHFTGGIKPWECDFGPWGKEFFNLYQRIARENPWISKYLSGLTDDTKLTLARAYRHRVFRSRLVFWRRVFRRYRFRGYLGQFRGRLYIDS